MCSVYGRKDVARRANLLVFHWLSGTVVMRPNHSLFGRQIVYTLYGYFLIIRVDTSCRSYN